MKKMLFYSVLVACLTACSNLPSLTIEDKDGHTYQATIDSYWGIHPNPPKVNDTIAVNNRQWGFGGPAYVFFGPISKNDTTGTHGRINRLIVRGRVVALEY